MNLVQSFIQSSIRLIFGPRRERKIEPSASETLKHFELYQEHYQTLAWAILEKGSKQGNETSVSDIEMQFAALETYQRETQSDAFSSLFYNNPELIGHMIAGTKTTGAEKAYNLLVRGLERLGLTQDAGFGEIHDASRRLISAIEGDAMPGDQTLLDDFQVLDDEFDEHVEHLEDSLVRLLLFYKDSFRSFP